MSDPIQIEFDQNRPFREQIELAIASLPPRPCRKHPHELYALDKAGTVDHTLRDQIFVSFIATFGRCTTCPHNASADQRDEANCAVGPTTRFGKFDCCVRDAQGKPITYQSGSANLSVDKSVREQFESWLLEHPEIWCKRGREMLRRQDARIEGAFKSTIRPQFARCSQCALEDLGILPDDAYPSFDNFKTDPLALRFHLEQCQAFCATPKGVLLLRGNVGTGKTHLAIAILRELLRQGKRGLVFIKHRHFLASHRLAQRPQRFGEEPPESPLIRCQEADLLVYDDLAAMADNRGVEDVLLDLFECRVAQFRPSVITTNLSQGELEAAIGTRLFDRLRRASLAVLEFGFESKRQALNAEYLSRRSIQ